MAEVRSSSGFADALIVGGGISGLATAILIKRAGMSCRIFEAYPGLANIGGGLQIFPNGMRILGYLGLEEKAKEAGALMTETRFKDLNGKPFASSCMGTLERYQHQTITIRRSVLHQLLIDEAGRNGLVVEYGKKLCRIEEAGERVLAEFGDGTSADGRFLVGADGVHSFVRKYVLPDFSGAKPSNLSGFMGFAPESVLAPDFRPGTFMEITVGRVGFFGYCYADNTKMNCPEIFWWCQISEDRLSQDEVALMVDEVKLREGVLQAHRNWPEPVGSLTRNSTSLFKVSLSDVLGLEKWHKGRVLIIGDAAHAMNPVNGQGASSGLEDAVLLAEILKRMPDQPSKVFEKFEFVRKPRVDKLVTKGRKSGQRFALKTGPVSSWLRNRTFALLSRVTSRRWSDWVFGYDPMRDATVLEM